MEIGRESVQYRQFSGGHWETIDAEVIVETSVSLTVNGEVWLSLMCTPVDLEAMAVGFLFNEGIIDTASEIASVRVCETGDNVDVWLHSSVERPALWRRTSGCTGGVTSIDEDVDGMEASTPVVSNGWGLSPEQINTLIAGLFQAQDLYRKTGGVHTSALSDGESIYVATEDIGRHNTLDKIAGRCLLDNIDLSRRVLLTTGRVSSEMLQKASRIEASIVISRTAPSSLSIQMAERRGITLIGYARRNRFTVYTHGERIA